MDCKLCKFPLVVLDLNDPNKPLRCSDDCSENRRSLVERGLAITPNDPPKRSWRTKL